MAGGFYLARMSIQYQYVGALACWTVVFTPIGTAIGVVLGKIVDKNKAENVAAVEMGLPLPLPKQKDLCGRMRSRTARLFNKEKEQ